jgi:hypothetical protein
MDPGLQEVAAEGASYSLLDYLGAVARREELIVAANRFHQSYDLLITPSLPIPAFEAGAEVPAGSGLQRWPEWTPFSYPFNLTQQPAASVPCGLTGKGLPAGLQIVGPRFAEALVLRAARAFEKAVPWKFPDLEKTLRNMVTFLLSVTDSGSKCITAARPASDSVTPCINGASWEPDKNHCPLRRGAASMRVRT